MKICVLVKEVPDAAVEKRIDPSTGRMDRSKEKNLNPYDTHAIEAAMQIEDGGAVPVEEIVAVTMGPDSAVRALHKAVSLGADRSVHLSDPAVAGSDVAATGYAWPGRSSARALTSSCSDSSQTTGSATRSARSWPTPGHALVDAGDQDGVESDAGCERRPSTATTPCRSSCRR